MTDTEQRLPSQCRHTINDDHATYTCDLPAGHTLGHHQFEGDHQWWDRSDDHGPGAYASIHPLDEAWRHEFGKCHEVWSRRTVAWCPWCLRHLLDKYCASFAPRDCNSTCYDGPCTCSGKAWRPDEVEAALNV